MRAKYLLVAPGEWLECADRECDGGNFDLWVDWDGDYHRMFDEYIPSE